MKNIGSKVGIFLVIICSILIVCWMGICVYDYLHKDKPKFCLDESRKLYTDGYVYSCTGLGYKIYHYKRKSITGKEFVSFWSRDKSELLDLVGNY